MDDVLNLAPGDIFGGAFRVVRPLGSGGMGRLYVVSQLQTGKLRALKLLVPQLVAHEDSRARFMQEARAAAAIDSEHVVDIVTAGEHAGADTSPIVFPSPESDAFVLVKEAGLRIVTLEKLIELKIASGIWGKRGQDLVDVQKLIQVNGLAEPFAEKLPAGLRTNYLELLRGAREERELAE